VFCRVTDTLPKHWGGAGSAAVPAQLEAKATSHQVLVSTLQQAGVFAQLPASACRQGLETLLRFTRNLPMEILVKPSYSLLLVSSRGLAHVTHRLVSKSFAAKIASDREVSLCWHQLPDV
jgi:hypothetical protein